MCAGHILYAFQRLRLVLLHTLNCNKTCSHFFKEPPQITEEPHDIRAHIGETAEFVCRVTGDPEPNIVWIQDSNEIQTADSRFRLLGDGTLKIDHVDSTTIGKYECMAKNLLGEAKSRTVRMAIEKLPSELGELPQIILPPYDVTVTSTGVILLHCIATGIYICNAVDLRNHRVLR